MTAVRAAEDSLLLRKDDYAVCNFKEQLSEQRLKDKEKEDLVAKSDKQPAWVSLHMGVAEKRQGLCVFFFGCGVWQPLAEVEFRGLFIRKKQLRILSGFAC